jgi:predicted enzyme related to lactoylglutathione lyase
MWEPERMGMTFQPVPNGLALLHVDDVAAAREDLETEGVEFVGETFDTGVCHMAIFRDPDGNEMVLHNRYASYSS